METENIFTDEYIKSILPPGMGYKWEQETDLESIERPIDPGLPKTITVNILSTRYKTTLYDVPAIIKHRNYNPCFDKVIEPAISFDGFLGGMFDGEWLMDSTGYKYRVMNRVESQEVYDFLSR